MRRVSRLDEAKTKPGASGVVVWGLELGSALRVLLHLPQAPHPRSRQVEAFDDVWRQSSRRPVSTDSTEQRNQP